MKLPFRLSFASALTLTSLALFAYACSDADENTKKPSGPSGCIGEECYDEGGAPDDPGSADAGADGQAGFANPIEGTSKVATRVQGGFEFADGPVWIGGRLLFADVNANTILELKGDNTTATFRDNANETSGLAASATGDLYATESGAHRVIKSAATGDATRDNLASKFEGHNLNSPNDLVVKKDGNVYFTDPDYNASADAAARQPKQGVYRIATDGELTAIAQYDSHPNGVALSPDESVLYVSDTDQNLVRKFTVAADGAVGNEATFIAETANTPDGLAVDDAGNVYVATEKGVQVFDASGLPLGMIAVEKQPSSCTFGGSDRRTLYVTARDGLYAIRLNVPGLP